MLGDLKKASNRTVGMKQTLKAIQAGNVKLVFLAGDVDDYISQRIEEQCKASDIDIINVASMNELGKACGIAVGAATAAILE